jgi:hypothetical protein
VLIRRYTNLASTINLLDKRAITLLNPEFWEDKNDAHFMSEYKTYVKARTVLAICFAEGDETYHHWKVFSSGADGICIVFDKEKLLSAFNGNEKITMGSIDYKTLSEVKS